jgi:hypothetical protein
MSRDIISVQYPTLEDTQSVGILKVETVDVDSSKGIEIKNAFANKNNSLVICVENTSSSNSEITFVSSDEYPNSMLGDLVVDVPAQSVNAFQIQDMSRFENKDGSLYLDFKTGFAGNIYAVAKSADLNV